MNRIRVVDRLLVSMLRRRMKGTARLIRLLKGHQPNYLLRAKTRHGLMFNLDPDDHLDRIVLQQGYYEHETLDALLQCLGDTGVLWDIGANIGLHAITAKHLRPKVQVVCFEPSPFTFSRLYMNAGLNNTELQLMNVGLGNASGYLALNLTISGNSGQTSFKPWDHVHYERAIHCWCDTAVNMVRQGVAPVPTVVKLDVEGFEYEVLSGFEELLSNPTLKAIIFESPASLLTDAANNPIGHLLLNAGFKIERMECSVAEENSLANYIASR